MNSTDEFSLSTSYEPKAHDFSSADPDYDDAALEDMLHKAHRAKAYHPQREDLSVSLSSSSKSKRTGRPVGDRSGRPGEHRNSQAQIRTPLDNKSKFLQSAKQDLMNTNFK